MFKQISVRIESERLHQKITIEELSKKSGVSAKHISQIKTGKSNPTLKTLDKLANALGLEIDVTISELIGHKAKAG